MIAYNYNDEEKLDKIATRWVTLVKSFGLTVNKTAIITDLSIANGRNGNPPLDLDELLAFNDTRFAHDMSGISKYMHRESGKITGFIAHSAKEQGEDST